VVAATPAWFLVSAVRACGIGMPGVGPRHHWAPSPARGAGLAPLPSFPRNRWLGGVVKLAKRRAYPASLPQKKLASGENPAFPLVLARGVGRAASVTPRRPSKKRPRPAQRRPPGTGGPQNFSYRLLKTNPKTKRTRMTTRMIQRMPPTARRTATGIRAPSCEFR